MPRAARVQCVCSVVRGARGVRVQCVCRPTALVRPRLLRTHLLLFLLLLLHRCTGQFGGVGFELPSALHGPTCSHRLVWDYVRHSPTVLVVMTLGMIEDCDDCTHTFVQAHNMSAHRKGPSLFGNCFVSEQLGTVYCWVPCWSRCMILRTQKMGYVAILA